MLITIPEIMIIIMTMPRDMAISFKNPEKRSAIIIKTNKNNITRPAIISSISTAGIMFIPISDSWRLSIPVSSVIVSLIIA